MLVQQVEAQLVRPPVAVRRAAGGGVIERALDLVGHCIVSFCFVQNDGVSLRCAD